MEDAGGVRRVVAGVHESVRILEGFEKIQSLSLAEAQVPGDLVAWSTKVDDIMRPTVGLHDHVTFFLDEEEGGNLEGFYKIP